MQSEISQTQKGQCCMIPLKQIFRTGRFIETRCSLEFTGGWIRNKKWGVVTK